MKKMTKTTTGRPCSICTHNRVRDIDREIAKNGSFRNISKRWLGHERHFVSVFRHATAHLNLDVQTLLAEGKITRAIDAYHEFLEQLDFAKKLRDAAERWLIDPNDPNRFDICPRGDEVDIIYLDMADLDENGKPKRKKASLQELLARLKGTRYEPDTQTLKTVDLRDFTLKTLDRADTVIDRFAKLTGAYTKDQENDKTTAQVAQKVAEELIAQGIKPERARQIVESRYGVTITDVLQ